MPAPATTTRRGRISADEARRVASQKPAQARPKRRRFTGAFYGVIPRGDDLWPWRGSARLDDLQALDPHGERARAEHVCQHLRLFAGEPAGDDGLAFDRG